jgi:outer membrane protein assembly factor BamB
MNPCTTLLAASSLALLLGNAVAANWPQFRGPGGLGIGTGNPPVEMGPEKNVLWRKELAPGHSSPCIWGDKIALTALDNESLVTICLSRADGRELWRAVAPAEKVEGTHKIGSPASPTPCTDGTRLFSYFGSYGLLAYDWNGKEIWRKPLPPPVVEFGTGASPILADGKVILVADGDIGGQMLAFDAATGKEVWRTDRSEFRRSFSTPFVWKHSGGEELVVAGALWVRGYDIQSGKERWSSRGLARVSNATPTADGESLLVSSWNVGGDEDDRVEMEPFEPFAREHDANKDGLLSLDEFPKGKVRDRFSQMDADKDGRVTPAEYEHMRSMFAKAVNQLFAIKPGGKGDITESHVLWQVSRQLPYVSSPVAVNGRVFTMKNGGLVSCYEAKSGRVIYQGQRVDAAGEYYSSAVAAGGRIYITSQRGTLVVLDATSESLKVLSRSEMGDPVFATPAVLDGVVYLRTEKHLYAFKQ